MRRAVALVLGVIGAAGCAGPKAYVRPGLLEQPPRRVAVLPFVITHAYDLAEGQSIPEHHQLGADLFRKTFYYTFATYGYEDVRLAEVDATLGQRWGPVGAGGWRSAGPQQLGEALGVDALIYGDVERVIHFATPALTETSLHATLRMVEARTGETLWRQRVRAAERGGAFLQKSQVVDFIKDQMRSYQRGVKFLRVADLAARKALKELPNPTLGVGATPEADWRPRGARGVRLAIVPFGARPAWGQAATALRRDLTANMQDGPFDVIELQRVDTALAQSGWQDGQPVPAERSVALLNQRVGADAVLRGTVTEWGRSYWLVQSWVKAGLAVELLDAHTGAVIWRDERRNTKTSGLLKGPTGYKALAMAPLQGLKTSYLERVATHLTRTVAEDLKASGAVLAYVSELRGDVAQPLGATPAP